MATNSAFLFPAFITDYTNKELEVLSGNGIDFNKYIQRASNPLGVVFPEFSYESDTFRDDELLAQIIAYLFSCAFADLMDQRKIKPSYVAGYSMGVYASLYASKSITLEEGVLIIFKAFKLVSELACSGEYGMGGIIGLDSNDIDEIIKKSNLNVEIINTNSEFSHVVAGVKNDVIKTLNLAKNEGALNTVLLNVNTPYHSKHLIIFKSRFAEFLSSIEFKNPEYPIVSTYNQRVIGTKDEIRKELIYNLTTKINWFKTMQTLINLGVTEFFECGAGKDLSKIARFIEGEFRFTSAQKI